jgi:acyl-CoA thioester hydrolase
VSAPWVGSRARFVYRTYARVHWRDCDPLGHVNNASYLGYLEQAAIDHAAAGGFDMDHLRELGGLFIARRHEIDYLHPAGPGDWLEIVTWPVELGAARATRAYRVYRIGTTLLERDDREEGLFAPELVAEPGPVIVAARTEWAFVDPDTGRPRRIPAEMIAAFLVG